MISPFRVRVPASAASLGPGLDVLALALSLYYEILVEPATGPGELVLHREGELSGLTGPPHQDPTVLALTQALATRKRPLPPLSLRATSEVPLARGLGNSACALVAGLQAAELPLKEPLSPAERTGIILGAEGHPDHAFASLAGGLVATVLEWDQRAQAELDLLKLELHPSWRFVLAWPDVRVAPFQARRVLPATYPRGLLPRALGRLLLLVRALKEGDPAMLAMGLRDETHVPYRAGLVPPVRQAMEAAVQTGAAGATLAGGGPAVLAVLTSLEPAEQVLAAMVAAFQAQGLPAAGRIVQADLDGAQVVEVQPP